MSVVTAPTSRPWNISESSEAWPSIVRVGKVAGDLTGECKISGQVGLSRIHLLLERIGYPRNTDQAEPPRSHWLS